MIEMGHLFLAFYREGFWSWWDYPGLELWKFFNLLLFLGAGAYLLRRPLSSAFVSRREGIRRRFLTAKAEMDKGLSKLGAVEWRLAQLDSDIEAIKLRANAEAAAERERIELETDREVNRLRWIAERDLVRLAKVARRELKWFAARQAVNLAGEMMRSGMETEDDARLILLGVEQLGRGAS